MKPTIDETTFGSITIEGKAFEHDVLIRQNGQIEKRKKKLSKALYGTSLCWLLRTSVRLYSRLRAFARSLFHPLLLVDDLREEYN